MISCMLDNNCWWKHNYNFQSQGKCFGHSPFQYPSWLSRMGAIKMFLVCYIMTQNVFIPDLCKMFNRLFQQSVIIINIKPSLQTLQGENIQFNQIFKFLNVMKVADFPVSMTYLINTRLISHSLSENSKNLSYFIGNR